MTYLVIAQTFLNITQTKRIENLAFVPPLQIHATLPAHLTADVRHKRRAKFDM